MKNQDADKISDIVNNTLFNNIEVGKELANDHPYLQQQTFKMMLAFIEEESRKTNMDARNEFTVRLCKELQKVVKDFVLD